MPIPRYLYRGTTAQHYGDTLLWMHANPEDKQMGFPDRIYFTTDPASAVAYTSPNAAAGLIMEIGGKPLVIRIDTTEEPELRRMLHRGKSEPNEWFVPVGILHLRHPPLIVMVGNTGRSQVEHAPTWLY